MKEGTDLEELVEQFTAQVVSVRLSAYRTLIQKCTGGGAMVKYNWSDFLSEEDTKKTILNIKSDLSSDSEELSYEAAGACGCLLASGSFVSMLQASSQKEIVEDLIKVIKEKKGKKVVVRTLWCISRSKFGHDVYKEKATVLIEAVCDILKNETSASAALEALQVVHALMEIIPEVVMKDLRIWFPISFKYVIHEADRVRSIVFIILYSVKMFLDDSSDKVESRNFVIACLAAEMHSKTCKKMRELVSKDSTDILRGWRLIVQILGTVLHKGTSLINDLLEVVEKGFKSTTPTVRVEAFRCWKALIDNFALDLDVLTHHKRLKLLLAPLKANNAKSEAIAHEKLLVWWHLIVRLKKHAASQFDTVVVPLLKFCFSGTSSSSPGGQNVGLAQRNLMMSVAASPGCKFPGMVMLSAELIAQILSAGIDIPERQAFVFSISPLEEPLINDTLFVRSLQLLFACIGEVFHSFNDETDEVKRRNRQSALVILIIQSVVSRILKVVKSEGNKKESIEQVKEMFTLFSEIEHSCRPGDPLSEYVLKFYEIITTSQGLALPLSVINSRHYNISTGNTMQDMMSGTLSNHIIQQLCKPPLLHLATKKEEYFTVWITVLSNSKPSTGKLGFLQYVVKELEGAEPFFNSSHPDTLRRMWACTVRQLLSHIEQTQIIDQGDGMEHDWICIYNMLLFPINQSVTGFKNTSEEFNQKVVADWSELWSKFTELTPLAVTADPNSEIEYIARGMVNVFKRVVVVSTSENYGITYNLMANFLLLLTQKMRYSELGKPSLKQVNSPAKAKKKSHPLCNLSGCVELFALLFMGLMRMGACPGRISTAQLLCESIMNILRGVHQEKLINPLIAEILPTITEGFKVSPFVRFSAEVGRQFVKVLRSFSLMFEEQIGSAHTADHINRLEPLLLVTLTSATKEIKQAGRQFWKSSFSNTSHSIPSALYEVLKECSLPPASLNDSQDDFEEFNTNPKENVPDNVMPGSFLKRAGGVDGLRKYDSPKSKFDSPKANRLSLGTPKPKEKTRISLHEMNEEEFVKVSSPKPSRRVLTEHQIEKLKERKDIPALYSDLSQSASQIILPTQFASQQSFEESILNEATNSKKLAEDEKVSPKQLTFTGLLNPDKRDDKINKAVSPSKIGRRSMPVQTSLGKGKGESSNKFVGSEEATEVKIKKGKVGDGNAKEVHERSMNNKIRNIDDKEEKMLQKDREYSPIENDTSDSKVSSKKSCSQLQHSKETDLKSNVAASELKESANTNHSRSVPEVGIPVDGDNVKLSEMKENIESPAPLMEGGARLRSMRKQGLSKNEASVRKDSLDNNKVLGTPKSQASTKKKSTPRSSVPGVRTRRSRGVVEQFEPCDKTTNDKEEPVSESFVNDKAVAGEDEDRQISQPLRSEEDCNDVTVNEPVNSGETESKKSTELQSVVEVVDNNNEKIGDSEQVCLSTHEETNIIGDKSNIKGGMMLPSPQKANKEKQEMTFKTVKTYPGKMKECVNSDYTDEDLDEELRKTSVVLQNSLKDSPVADNHDTQFLLDSNRRKSQTPSKKTIEDVRKVLKGQMSVTKSPSESRASKDKPALVKSHSCPVANETEACTVSTVMKQTVFDDGDTSCTVDVPNVKCIATKPVTFAKDGDEMDTDSDELVPSSQDDDESLTAMAHKIPMSRLGKRESAVKDQTEIVKESDEDCGKDKSTRVSRKAKRKRALNDEVEEDVKQRLKRKRTATVGRENSGEDLCIVGASDDEAEKSKKATSQSKGGEAEKSNKLVRKSSSSNNTPNSQNSYDLFEGNGPITTPPKVTRSGRKIVAPKKDMPEPMTPPGCSSGKKKKTLESTIESPKSKVSPSLLSNVSHGYDVDKPPESETISHVEKSLLKETVVSEEEVETVAKRNVQKKITDMFSKENKEPVQGKVSLPEMDKLENDLLEKESATSVADSMKNYSSINESDMNGREANVVCTFKEKSNFINSEDMVHNESNTGNKEIELGEKVPVVSPVLEERISTGKGKEITREKSWSPLKNTRPPLKKRLPPNLDSLELLSNGGDNNNQKSVEIVTSVPESIDVEEIGSSILSTTEKSEKVLSPKKKWSQAARESEMAFSKREEYEISSGEVAEDKDSNAVERDVASQPNSLIKENASDQIRNKLVKFNDESHQPSIDIISSPKISEKPVQIESDDDSDMEVDVEMIDQGQLEKSTKATSECMETAVGAPVSVAEEGVIDISSSSSVSPESRHTSENLVVQSNDAEAENVIVLSNESKDSSDEMPKSSSKSSDSSSLENAQRIDEELKEVDRKSSKSPKKERIFKINVEEKQSEEESSPEKSSVSKFTHTIGTPERQKKFASMKYAGSRAAMLVACAKQNIKNRSNDGESPSKLTVGDALKNRLGHSPVHRGSARSVSPSGTPPTPGCKKRSHENENGKPWVKHEPSPGATPSPSILKKSAVEENLGRDTTSPPSKQRRVSFADPPVSDRVEIPPSPKTLKSMRAQKRLDMTKADSPPKATPPSDPEESQPDPDSPIDVNCSQPLYPPLTSCKDMVDRVALELTSPFLNKKGTDILIENVEAQLSEIFGEDGEVRVDDNRLNSTKTNESVESGTLLHSGLEKEDLHMEDGITPLESTVENVSCETINRFCKHLSENPQLLDVLVENLDEKSRQKLLQKILVELPYGAVLDTYFKYLRKRDPSSSSQ
ncbi:telomere-associated protein RIF1-like isoform X2 [Macrobrachium nipponense]|uniref:telomere-associated protein RIF1-like isoform X2 n=1 Tax=Macrobrachium nipponense TaxID=159736 RepID=UPI0030C86E7D